jgi:hypothetical protein
VRLSCLLLVCAALATAGPTYAHGNLAAAQSLPWAPRSDEGGPLLTVHSPSADECQVSWENEVVSESELLDRAASFLQTSLYEVGAVRDGTPAAANFRIDSRASFLCVRKTLQVIQAAGFREVQIDQPRAGDGAWVLPLAFVMLSDDRLPLSPFVSGRARITLDSRGLPSWNGRRVGWAVLRQRLDLTSQNDALSQDGIVVQLPDGLPWSIVSRVLWALWLSNSQKAELVGEGTTGQDLKTLVVAAAHGCPSPGGGRIDCTLTGRYINRHR